MCEKNYKTERIQEVDERVCLLFYRPWSRIGNPGKSQRNLKNYVFFPITKVNKNQSTIQSIQGRMRFIFVAQTQ